VPPALVKIISGGQTGVDQAALRAAKACGLAMGGWCPPGRACESGVIPPEFPLQETKRERSPDAPDVPRSQRTEWNVRDSDATLVVRSSGASHSEAATEEDQCDPGTNWTVQCAARYKRPLLVCDVDDPDAPKKIQEWLGNLSISTLNVSGPSEGISPGIGDRAYRLLLQTLEGTPLNGR
jgi:putative molybdenum carrier protein